MLAIAVAFLLDLLIGDPVYPFHPVRLMGKGIDRSEFFLRSRVRNEKLAGGILAIVFPWAVFAAVWVLLYWVHKWNLWLAWAVNVYGIYASLSIHDLRKEAMHVLNDLERDDLEKARTNLARIVGRDTSSLNREEVLRAAIETVAESTVDGIVSPLFFAALGGAPLALAYKAVNTLDSMIGHLNERYREFGYFAAKQDEAWNWIPARLAYFAIACASFILKRSVRDALSTGWRDGVGAPHGISAIPEAAFAGALGLRLGGPSTYQGRLVKKPFLGSSPRVFETEDLKKSLELMMAASWVSAAGAVCLSYGIGQLLN